MVGEELAASGRDVDVLIVGSRGYGPVRRRIQGSTPSYLLGHAPCVLLVLPRAAAPATEEPNGKARQGVNAETGRRPVGATR